MPPEPKSQIHTIYLQLPEQRFFRSFLRLHRVGMVFIASCFYEVNTLFAFFLFLFTLPCERLSINIAQTLEI